MSLLNPAKKPRAKCHTWIKCSILIWNKLSGKSHCVDNGNEGSQATTLWYQLEYCRKFYLLVVPQCYEQTFASRFGLSRCMQAAIFTSAKCSGDGNRRVHSNCLAIVAEPLRWNPPCKINNHGQPIYNWTLRCGCRIAVKNHITALSCWSAEAYLTRTVAVFR